MIDQPSAEMLRQFFARSRAIVLDRWRRRLRQVHACPRDGALGDG